jgi:hypothetical protein
MLFSLSQLKNSNLWHAILVPAAMGSLVYIINYANTNIIQPHILSRMYSTVTINNSELVYFDAVLDFIQCDSLLKTNHFTVCRPKVGMDPSDDGNENHETLQNNVHYQPTDAGSSVSFVYKGRRIYLSRRCGGVITAGKDRSVVRVEDFSLSVFGIDPTVIKSLIADAVKRVNVQQPTGRVRILAPSNGWYAAQAWSCVQSKKPRSFDSVILDKSLAQRVVDDAQMFMGSKQWYDDMGIPYRRGYLLHGPPGCGKTSFCLALAGVLQLDVCLLSLSEKSLSDSDLLFLFRNAPLRSIILLEDVDAVFICRENKDDDSRITFSGLLNAIDGVASQEGRMVLMTSNHLDLLDPALIRPGRIDIQIMVSCASAEQLEAMFLRFFPGYSDEARRFATSLPSGVLSLAQVQEHLVKYRLSVNDAVAEAASELLVAEPHTP